MTLNPADLAHCLLLAPRLARVGLSAPNSRTREAAALELATSIASRLDGRLAAADGRQLGLPL